MSVFQIKRLVRPETLRTIGTKSLLSLLRPHRTFFEEHGLQLPAGKNAAGPDLDRLAAILMSPDLRPPKALAEGLYYINELATHDGMDALLPELEGPDHHLKIFRDETPADVAVRAWVKSPAVVAQKHAELMASRPRTFQYFQSHDDPPRRLPSDMAARLPSLERYLDEVFASRRRGKGTRVLAYPHGEDDCLFMVRHGDPRRREGALEGVQETSVFYRPLRFDVVGYDAATGTLRVYASTKWETSLYRNGFGRFLFGALDFFPSTSRYTLEPLRSGEPACLACADAPPIKLITLTELQLLWGGVRDFHQVFRATNVFYELRERGIDFGTALIKQATFTVKLFGVEQARKVTIIPPNIARYSHEDESQLINHWLALRGFINDTRRLAGERDEAYSLLRGA